MPMVETRRQRATSPGITAARRDHESTPRRLPRRDGALRWPATWVQRAACGAPWQRLYFLPEPHGHGALRPGSPLEVAEEVVRSAVAESSVGAEYCRLSIRRTSSLGSSEAGCPPAAPAECRPPDGAAACRPPDGPLRPSTVAAAAASAGTTSSTSSAPVDGVSSGS